MRKLPSLILTTALLASAVMQPVLAQERQDRDEGHHEEGQQRPNEGHQQYDEGRHFREQHGDHFQGGGWREHGDIHRFHEHDYDHWREGRWYHGHHEGRNGWWWILGGAWYFYPAPVYPYPDPYTPPVVNEYVPVVPQNTAPSYVYYCTNPRGYYPYVTRCYGSWQQMGQVNEINPPMDAPVTSQREIDDRELNTLATEFQNIDLNSRHARQALKSVEQQVRTFRQTLYQRDYNAMDILRDAEDLEHRIEEQRAELSPHPRS